MSDPGNLKWFLSLDSSRGPGVLLPTAFYAEESISAPFMVSVDVVSRDPINDLNEMLFTPATLTVQPNAGTPRFFNGIVREITANSRPERGWWHYTLIIVPKLWFMSQTEDCRVFQQMSVGDIVTQLCGEANQSISLRVNGDAQQAYVTQYNETDLNFTSRIMESAGFFYFFEHSSSNHTLVVACQNTSFPAGPAEALAVIHGGGNIDTLTAWNQTSRTAWGKARLMDYDPSQPGTLLDATTPTSSGAGGSSTRDVMRWPALTTDGGKVADRTRFMIEAAEAEASLIMAAGSNHELSAGSCFTLYRDPFTQDENVGHVVRHIVHRGGDSSYMSGGAAAYYSNSFSAFPKRVTWRQPIVTPRPVMAGVYGGIVLGGDGEEIHADSLGRIKLRLFWDHRRETKADQAVWVRVIQPWAGNTWGWQHLPRVGTEVAVAFMDGDPDRPVVVGGLYNGAMMPVFALPDEMNKSGWRTRSTTQGGTDAFSEFSVDDSVGQEILFLHAQKDLKTEVENDQTLTVDNNRTVEIKKQESIKIGDKQTVQIQTGRETTISQSGDKLTVQSGDLTISVSSGQVSIEAMTAIELSVGANSVKIDPSGITLQGTMVTVQGQSIVKLQSPMVQVSADGMLQMTAGVVTMN